MILCQLNLDAFTLPTMTLTGLCCTNRSKMASNIYPVRTECCLGAIAANSAFALA